jgi:hypothetical protein
MYADDAFSADFKKNLDCIVSADGSRANGLSSRSGYRESGACKKKKKNDK